MTTLPNSVRNSLDAASVVSKLPDVVLIHDEQWDHIKKGYNMTLRELQIAKYVCHGLSNQQIAANLKIQQGTVKTHMRNIYRKTWVNNKIAMLLRFVEATNSMGASLASQSSIEAVAQS